MQFAYRIKCDPKFEPTLCGKIKQKLPAYLFRASGNVSASLPVQVPNFAWFLESIVRQL